MPSYSGIFSLQNQMQAVAVGNWPNRPPPLTIGQPYGGGFYAGQISTTGNGVATHYLIVASKSAAESTLPWKTSTSDTPGTSSDIDGPSNSLAMNNADHPAARYCENLGLGGFTDWYLPAKNELDVCYFHLKPTTTSNTTGAGTGINPNAVPARGSAYTTSNPAQTSVTAFQSGGAEAFNAVSYWTSTQGTSTITGRTIQFDSGYSPSSTKTNLQLVRPVRRIPI